MSNTTCNLSGIHYFATFWLFHLGEQNWNKWACVVDFTRRRTEGADRDSGRTDKDRAAVREDCRR